MTLDKRASAELERPIETRDDLTAYFRAGEKPRDRFRLGIEHEKLAVRLGTFEAVPYDGPRGIETLLVRLAEEPGFEEITEDGRVLGLDGPASVSLEPGGQVEQNGSPHRDLHEAVEEIHAHLGVIRRVAEPLGIALIGLGADPFHPTKELTQIPRERYRIMRSYLPSRGELALDMMHATASLQVSFDWYDEADMIAAMRASLAVTPIVTACFANSSLHLGRPSGFVSRRAFIWRHTDPDRSGLCPSPSNPDFGYERYAEWALDVPMFFIVRDGRYSAMHGKTFRRFWQEGHDGERATLADWDRHLTTLFPEVRMKRVLEVRCADAVPVPLLGCGSGAVEGDSLRRGRARRSRRTRTVECPRARRRTPRCGAARSRCPDAERTDARAGASAGGHRTAGPRAPGSGRRRSHRLLDPLDEIIERGKSPGEIVVERWQGEWAGSPDRLIDSTRY